MNDLYICTHYGFGDYVICYGLVRKLADKYDNVFLFAIPHRSDLHISNIKRLYSSIDNVQVIESDPGLYKDVLYVGWGKYRESLINNPSTQFQEFFYNQVGLPLNLMWDNFFFERDMEKEKAIFDSLGLNGVDYVFLHDDPVRNFIINRKNIPDMKVIHLVDLPEISILDTLYLVEKAKEVHVTTTGLVSFIDQMNIQHDNLNLHRYVRPEEGGQPILRLKWKIWN